MTLSEFKSSLSNAAPPDLSPLLKALWYDGKGDWTNAHELAQNVESKDGAWVHAYLHRKEGDLSNASYWYQQAGRKVKSGSLEGEWEDIVKSLIVIR